jgi:hypothetical protein
LALYPLSLNRERAAIQLHRAACLVRNGEVSDGVGHATAVIEGLADTDRTMMVLDVATSVLSAVPADERDRTVVRNYGELLALSAAPAPPALPSGDA